MTLLMFLKSDKLTLFTFNHCLISRSKPLSVASVADEAEEVGVVPAVLDVREDAEGVHLEALDDAKVDGQYEAEDNGCTAANTEPPSSFKEVKEDSDCVGDEASS